MILVSKLSDRLAKAKRELDISTRQMADRAEANGYKLSDYNAKVYTNGKHSKSPDASTLEALSFVLRVPLAEVRELAGLPAETEPFEAHPSSDLLTAPQRAAVNEIIRLMAEGNKGADDASQAEDQAGSSENVQGAGPGTPIDLAQARKVKDDPAAFGDQPRRGDLEDLQRRQDEADHRDLSDLTGYAADEGPHMDQDGDE